MAKGKDQNYVSVIAWMFFLFLAAMPCFGFPVTIFFAFVGENETRKNYFKAILAWYLVGILILAAGVAFGFWPQIQQFFNDIVRAFSK